MRSPGHLADRQGVPHALDHPPCRTDWAAWRQACPQVSSSRWCSDFIHNDRMDMGDPAFVGSRLADLCDRVRLCSNHPGSFAVAFERAARATSSRTSTCQALAPGQPAIRRACRRDAGWFDRRCPSLRASAPCSGQGRNVWIDRLQVRSPSHHQELRDASGCSKFAIDR